MLPTTQQCRFLSQEVREKRRGFVAPPRLSRAKFKMLLKNFHTLVKGWPKKFVLGCVIPPLAVGAISRNLGQTFLAISVYRKRAAPARFEIYYSRTYLDVELLHCIQRSHGLHSVRPCALTALRPLLPAFPRNQSAVFLCGPQCEEENAVNYPSALLFAAFFGGDIFPQIFRVVVKIKVGNLLDSRSLLRFLSYK